jgi:Mg2+ and Co2+ transporter CorA
MEGLFMPEKELWNIYQMVNHIIDLMDKAETPENEELFEKIRWALQEMELKITRMSNSLSIMEDSFQKFSEAYNIWQEEINQRYNKPKEAQ